MPPSWMAATWMASSDFYLCKTLLRETGCLGNPYFLPSIQLFDSSPAKSVRPPLVTYPSLWSTCVTYKMPCNSIGHQVFPTQPLPREVQNFPRGERHFKHVLLSHT